MHVHVRGQADVGRLASQAIEFVSQGIVQMRLPKYGIPRNKWKSKSFESVDGTEAARADFMSYWSKMNIFLLISGFFYI